MAETKVTPKDKPKELRLFQPFIRFLKREVECFLLLIHTR